MDAAMTQPAGEPSERDIEMLMRLARKRSIDGSDLTPDEDASLRRLYDGKYASWAPSYNASGRRPFAGTWSATDAASALARQRRPLA